MEKRITVHNPTDMPIYVGSHMVPPKDTRDFPESLVPPHLRPQEESAPAEEAPVDDPMADLLAGSVASITAEFERLGNDELDRLAEMEQLKGDGARKTLLSAIAETLLTRAADESPVPPEDNPDA